jgi:hypothetical protein
MFTQAELEMMLDKRVVAYFKIISRNSHGKLRKSQKCFVKIDVISDKTETWYPLNTIRMQSS